MAKENTAYDDQPQRREGSRTVSGKRVSDGAGVRLTRLIGTEELEMLDPFLLLDSFRSDRSEDYLGGFPPHPHRGFETITYLLHGRMRHRDSNGHAGVLQSGGVQWMRAGRGILHSEMPEQEQGLLHGFQLWVNLPRDRKMSAPRYRDYASTEIPVEQRGRGVEVRVIAGRTAELGTTGAVDELTADILYLDIYLPQGARFSEPMAPGYNAALYLLEGAPLYQAGDSGSSERLPAESLMLPGPGEELVLAADEGPARILLFAGRPIGEPVVRGGPFVMSTEAQLRQAFNDYRSGRFGTIGEPMGNNGI
jgi:redox-sensitive bicupin YhaK (pirin superfamily)